MNKLSTKIKTERKTNLQKPVDDTKITLQKNKGSRIL